MSDKNLQRVVTNHVAQSIESETNTDEQHESRLVQHARDELAFMLDGCQMNERMYHHLIHMVREFSKEGHSGFSAAYARQMLNSLLDFQPIKPLTGESNEWQHVDENLWQNKRCSRVFCDQNGNAHDIQGRVFINYDGTSFTSKDSRVAIQFPYTPTTEYVHLSYNEHELPFE